MKFNSCFTMIIEDKMWNKMHAYIGIASIEKVQTQKVFNKTKKYSKQQRTIQLTKNSTVSQKAKKSNLNN